MKMKPQRQVVSWGLASTCLTFAILLNSAFIMVASSSGESMVSNQPVVAPTTSSAPDFASGSQAPAVIEQQQQQQQLAPNQRLPNINIYISKNEIRKLLGIDTRINYVTNGNINTYPLAFTIPLGYNQSDIIFTWQNLGQTNVNYSISLVIGNVHAVDTPLINITRSGLIPKHEQVFKITLPCSGKVTDEVDVQVLIQITGSVPEESELADSALASQFEPAPLMTQAETNASAAAAGLMQADQGEAKVRLVSHKLAIKRKKICTMHPVPVPVQPRIQPQVQPPSPPQQPPQVRPQQPQPANKRAQYQVEASNQLISKESGARPALTFGAPSNQAEQSQAQQQSEPAASTEAATGGGHQYTHGSSTSSLVLDASDPLEVSTKKLEHLNLIPARSQHNQQQHFGRRPSGEQHLSSFYPNWPQRPTIASQPPQLVESVLNDIVISNRQQQLPSSGNSPLVLVLVALLIVLSVALVAAFILGSSGSSRNRSPLDKLHSLTSSILRTSRAPASRTNKCKSPMAGAVISSLRAGPKSAASSVSGLSALSGQGQQGKLPAYCYKSNCAASGYYTSASNHYQQQHPHYQHPPTADLLGTGYQCQQQAAPAQCPIYHIATGNNSQTTRLIWSSGNGTSPDGYTVDGGIYMPLSNAPRSDSGSVYQTIH